MNNQETNRITLGHGSGGRLTHDLINSVFARALSNPFLDPLDDAGVLPNLDGPIAMTTDSFVVDPLFFNGGDIGTLAINGTVNDLAVSGALPKYLTLAAIIEEGLPISTLERIVASIKEAAYMAGVVVVSGDTKVVEAGKGDKIFLNTAGIGNLRPEYQRLNLSFSDGDAVLVSGPVGDHGAVIMAARSGINLETDLKSDCASVMPLVDALFKAGVVPLFMRDPTRGGLAGVICDLAEKCGLGVAAYEEKIPINSDVQVICDIIGVDPLHLACEGRVVAVVKAADEKRAIEAWHNTKGGEQANCIGRIVNDSLTRVILTTRYGGSRLIVRPTAEQLPRIC